MGGHTAGLQLAGLVVAWLGGVVLACLQPAVWPLSWSVACIAGGCLGWLSSGWWAWQGRPARWWWPLAMAGLCSLGLGLSTARAGLVLAEALPPALENQDLLIEGTVADLPRQVPGGLRFLFEVQAAWPAGQPVPVPRRVLLGWYAGRDETDDAGPPMPVAAAQLRAGERWRLPVRLRQPHGVVNPHGFDRELWLFEQGIRATGSVRGASATAPQRLAPAPAASLDAWRQQARDALLQQVPDARIAGVLAALALGDQAAIDAGDWRLFRDTGVAHLMSISGLHVTMLAWLAAVVIGRLWRRSARAVALCAAPLAARWGGVAVAAAYAAFAGWGVPAQRTVWMLATAAALAQAGLRWPPPLVLLAAAAVVTALDPCALLQPGFWLSFVAVGLLMASGSAALPQRPEEAAADGGPDLMPLPADPPQGAWPRVRAAAVGLWRQACQAFSGLLRAQALATLGLAPLTLVIFQQISLVGFVANLLAIPWVTLVVTPLALAGLLLPPLWLLAAAAMQGLAWLLQALQGWPGAVFTVAAAPAWAQAAGLAGGLLLVMRLPWRLRLLGLPLVLPLLWPPQQRPAEGGLEVVAADIGQGTAVLVRTRTHLLVFDTGPSYGTGPAQPANHDGNDAGARVLLPLLQARGERRIDLLVLSHRDSDHVGGAASVMAGLPVAALLSSLEDGHPLLAGPRPQQRCTAGQHWTWDGVQFEVLHPTAESYGLALKPNARSCVLQVVDAAGRSLLLTGDIEAAQEAQLVARLGPRLRSQVLVVPHHGSRTSSTPAWLQAVAPQVAVVQAGYLNRFGHPHPAVLARYTDAGIALVRSDTCGAWTWRDGAMSCERQSSPQFWRRFPPSP